MNLLDQEMHRGKVVPASKYRTGQPVQVQKSANNPFGFEGYVENRIRHADEYLYLVRSSHSGHASILVVEGDLSPWKTTYAQGDTVRALFQEGECFVDAEATVDALRYDEKTGQATYWACRTTDGKRGYFDQFIEIGGKTVLCHFSIRHAA